MYKEQILIESKMQVLKSSADKFHKENIQKCTVL